MQETKQITVLYVVNQISIVGGIEKIVLDKADWLIKHGYRVYICTTEEQVTDLLFFSHNPQIYFCHNLLHTLRCEKVDFVQFTRPMFRLMARCRLLHPHIKYGVELHACYEVFNYGEDYFRTFEKKQDLSFKKMCDRLFPYLEAIVVSARNDGIRKWGYDNVRCIYNFTNLQFNANIQPRQKLVVAVGRYVYQKGFEYLIQAWQRVAEVCPDWQLQIWGDGEQREYLQQLIEERGVQQQVKLMGYVTQMTQLFSHVSLFVMSSRYEGFGIVLVDAQRCGVPTISFNLPSGPSDIINDGVDGFLCRYLDESDLADKIIKVLQDDNLREKLSRAAIQNSMRFTPENIMPQWDELFRQSLSTPYKQPIKGYCNSLFVEFNYLKNEIKAWLKK